MLLWSFIHWTIAVGFMILAVEALYFLAPNIKQRLRATRPGAVFPRLFPGFSLGRPVVHADYQRERLWKTVRARGTSSEYSERRTSRSSSRRRNEARPPSLHCQLGGNVSANLLPRWEFNTSLVMNGLPDIRVVKVSNFSDPERFDERC